MPKMVEAASAKMVRRDILLPFLMAGVIRLRVAKSAPHHATYAERQLATMQKRRLGAPASIGLFLAY